MSQQQGIGSSRLLDDFLRMFEQTIPRQTAAKETLKRPAQSQANEMESSRKRSVPSLYTAFSQNDIMLSQQQQLQHQQALQAMARSLSSSMPSGQPPMAPPILPQLAQSLPGLAPPVNMDRALAARVSPLLIENQLQMQRQQAVVSQPQMPMEARQPVSLNEYAHYLRLQQAQHQHLLTQDQRALAQAQMQAQAQAQLQAQARAQAQAQAQAKAQAQAHAQAQAQVHAHVEARRNSMSQQEQLLRKQAKPSQVPASQARMVRPAPQLVPPVTNAQVLQSGMQPGLHGVPLALPLLPPSTMHFSPFNGPEDPKFMGFVEHVKQIEKSLELMFADSMMKQQNENAAARPT